MTRLTQRKIKELIREERQASKMYRGWGMRSIASDESKHSAYLKTLLAKK